MSNDTTDHLRESRARLAGLLVAAAGNDDRDVIIRHIEDEIASLRSLRATVTDVNAIDGLLAECARLRELVEEPPR